MTHEELLEEQMKIIEVCPELDCDFRVEYNNVNEVDLFLETTMKDFIIGMSREGKNMMIEHAKLHEQIKENENEEMSVSNTFGNLQKRK
jgi:hypothetical protein